MSEIIYNPEDVGTEITSSRGKLIKVRKYHMTPEEMDIARAKWELEVSNVDQRLKKKVSPNFFNPYRKGIYYYQLQVLFLLGANRWHSLTDIIKKLEEYTSGISLKKSVARKHGYNSAWDKFRGKRSREGAQRCKDYVGRVQENFIFLQRLSRQHPYGYKLHQVGGAVDIKRVSRRGFEQGIYFYRLSTYPTIEEALPIRDFSGFTFPKHEGKYIGYKFIGTIVTKDRKIIEGIEV